VSTPDPFDEFNAGVKRARQEYATRPFIHVAANPCIEPWCWGQRVVGEARCAEHARHLQATERNIYRGRKKA